MAISISGSQQVQHSHLGVRVMRMMMQVRMFPRIHADHRAAHPVDLLRGEVDDGVGVAVALTRARGDVRGVLDGGVHLVRGLREGRVGRVPPSSDHIRGQVDVLHGLPHGNGSVALGRVLGVAAEMLLLLLLVVLCLGQRLWWERRRLPVAATTYHRIT